MNKAKAAKDSEFFFITICSLLEFLGQLLLAFGSVGWGMMRRDRKGKSHKVQVYNHQFVSKYYQNKLARKGL